MDCGIQMFMFRISEGDPFLVSLLKNHDPKLELEELLDEPEVPGEPFELPQALEAVVEVVLVRVVLEELVLAVFLELMMIPLLSMLDDFADAELASNLVATQLNSLVCKQAKVIITGKSEIKNKAKVSLDNNKCNSCQKLQKLHHIFDLNLLYALAQKQRLLIKRRKNSCKYVDILAK